MQQREEKMLDASLDAIIQRVQELKNSIGSFLFKLEHEYATMNWPSVLDNYALLSGQINTLNRWLRGDKMPPLRNLILLPLHLSPDRDAEIERLTEGRVLAFNHEVVPAYLRTKPEPEFEEKTNLLYSKTSMMSADAIQKQITSLNKMSQQMQDTIKSLRESWESELVQKASNQQMSSQSDTNTLIAAVSFGKNLKPAHMVAAVSQSSLPDQRSLAQANTAGASNITMAKVPSAIKTNIKSASSVHPYAR